MEGSDDGGRGPWSYGEQTGRSGSSSSGTDSTAHTSSQGSHLSSISTEAAMHLDYLEFDDDDVSREETEKMKRVKSLVQEFFGAPSASYGSINGGDMSVLERWFTKLGVGWVLHVAGGASAGGDLEHTFASAAGRWIRALAEIMGIFGSTMLLFPDRICEEGPEAASTIPDQFQFVRFIQETMLKMLAFVDVIVSNGVLAAYEKLDTLLDVRYALSKALSQIWSSSYLPPSAEVERTVGEIVSLLSAKEGKAGEAMWSTMEEIRARILESMEDSSGTQGSSDVHKVTLSAMRYIKFLLTNYSSLAPIVSEAASLGTYVHQIGEVPPLASLILEMAYYLEEKLASKSESFPDQSLRFLFLLNNSYFIWQQVHPVCSFIEFKVSALARDFWSFHLAAVNSKLEGYMESYLQASWAPVLSCLFNPTPLCYRRASPLPKFESEFEKTCTTQELWKVPYPGLRERLRKAITERIIPAYTKYIEDNNITTPRVTPQQLEGMLLELFEG